MLRRRTLLFGLSLLISLSALAPRLQAQDLSFLSDSTRYHWPTDATQYLSSTYGETRAAHFHAGLDIRTWGREGYQVFATRDGIIHRVGISPYGYGNVVFMRHEDDSFSVYAHLNRFAPEIQQVVDSIRIANDFASDLDLNLESHELRFQQGDRIAWTGSTGAGPPHLHFELRTPDDEPFNPLLTNLSDSVEDTRPPVFTGLAIEHLDPSSYHVERRTTQAPLRRGTVTDLGRHSVSGPVGLAVNVHDRADRTPNVYAVYQLTLRMDGDTLFSTRKDAYSMEMGTQMFIDRVFPILNRTRAGYQRLYRTNGNRLPFYQKESRTRGIVDLPEGDHDLEIIAEDYYGNRSTARLTLQVQNRSSEPAWRIASIPTYPNEVELDGVPTGLARLHEISPFRVSPGYASLDEGPTGEGGEPTSPTVTRTTTPLVFYSREPSASRTTKELVPGRRQFLHLPDQSIWLEVPRDALFDTLRTRMTVNHDQNLPVVQFDPVDAPLQRPVRLYAILPATLEPDRRVGVFGIHPHRGFRRFLGSGYPGEILQADLREFMEVRFLYDETPPTASRPRIHRNLGGMPIASISVRDNMTGIDHARSVIRVNGQRGITEYVPDNGRIVFYLPGFEPAGSNVIDLELYDGMGNRAEYRFEGVAGL